jgi:hypothetical protein
MTPDDRAFKRKPARQRTAKYRRLNDKLLPHPAMTLPNQPGSAEPMLNGTPAPINLAGTSDPAESLSATPWADGFWRARSRDRCVFIF